MKRCSSSERLIIETLRIFEFSLIFYGRLACAPHSANIDIYLPTYCSDVVAVETVAVPYLVMLQNDSSKLHTRK